MMLTGRQCAAARTLAGLTQKELSERAGVNLRTLIDFENNRRLAKDETKSALVRALEQSNVQFLNREGVALAAA